MRCPACGTDNIPGVDVCENCGSDLAGLDLPEAAGGQLGRLLTDRLDEAGISEPVSIGAGESVAAAIRTMREQSSGCILVLDDEGRLSGLFNEKDLLDRVVLPGLDPNATPVADVMRPDPTCLQPDDPPAFAVHCMVSRDLRHLPVTSGDEILGIVSVRNILAYLTRDVLTSALPPSEP